MDYWRGTMNWIIDSDWKCQTCGNTSLTWGFINGQCRCDTCHTEYFMRENNGEAVFVPICQLMPEYVVAARAGWQLYHKPIDDFTDSEWDMLLPKSNELDEEEDEV